MLFILTVLAGHSKFVLHIGGIGCDGFFVLSGYLITSLVLAEYLRTGRLRLLDFYVNRAARLYPALIVLVILCAFFLHDIGLTGSHYAYCATATLTYVQDLIYLNSKPGGCTALGITWSLGVEEQFYLIWPAVLVFLLRSRRSILPVLVVGVCLSYTLLAVTTQAVPSGPAPQYLLPWNRAFEFLVGGVIAVAFSRITLPKWAWGPIAWCSVGLFLWEGTGRGFALTETSRGVVIMAPLAVLLSGCLILAVEKDETSSPARVLSLKPLAYIGKISYGIYLFHYPILYVLASHLDATHHGLLFLCDASCATAVASISYHALECPLRQRFKRVHPGSAPRATCIDFPLVHPRSQTPSSAEHELRTAHDR